MYIAITTIWGQWGDAKACTKMLLFLKTITGDCTQECASLMYMIQKGSEVYCIWQATETSILPNEYCSLPATLPQIIQLMSLTEGILNKIKS